jgi:Glycosyl transferase family 2
VLPSGKPELRCAMIGLPMSEIDYCITTMMRPQALERLLLSIAAHQPAASIHVADQGEEFDPAAYDRLAERLERAGLRERPTVHRLPFDCGSSAARNFLVDATPSEYKLIIDDDGVFTADTDIDLMARLLDGLPTVGIVGGAVARRGRLRSVGTMLQRNGSQLREVEAPSEFEEHDGIRYQQVDFLPNFGLMRRGLFEHLRWDPELKTSGEHLDFYLRLPQTPYIAVFTPDAFGEHPPIEADKSYKRLRLRGQFLKLMMEKHGLTRITTRGGSVTERQPDGRLVRGRLEHTEPADQTNT